MEIESWWLLAIPLFFGLGWFAARLDLRSGGARSRGALPEAYFRGLNFLLNEQPDKAIDAFVDVVRIDPETVELHFALGNLFRRRGETDRAIRVHLNLVERRDLDPAQREHALAVYRERYLDRGAYDSALYPGMAQFIRDVKAAGLPLSLATSKPELPATLMLEHFTVAHHFDIITGASADEVRSVKADVVAEALIRLKAMDADLTRPIMIGDRVHDVEGAAVHGVPTIGVSWGYAAEGEFEDAIAVAHDTDELRALIGI